MESLDKEDSYQQNNKDHYLLDPKAEEAQLLPRLEWAISKTLTVEMVEDSIQ